MNAVDYESMTVQDLRQEAKKLGVKLSAGINKQGIIERLTAANEQSEATQQETIAMELTETQGGETKPVRKASIIADDEPDEEDEMPVLSGVRNDIGMQRNVPGTSSKAPVFTMEGSRAWHNPRPYNSSSYQRPASQNTWTPRQTQMQTTYSPAQPVHTPQQTANRFGPDMRGDYQPAGYQQTVYSQQPVMPYQQPVGYPPQQMPAPAYGQQPMRREMTAQEALVNAEGMDAAGLVEVHPDGYAFMRAQGYLATKNDVYIPNAQVRRYNLRTGDMVEGKCSSRREAERYRTMICLTRLNDADVQEDRERPAFDTLTPWYPKRRIDLSARAAGDNLLRLMDLLSPIGFGQRAMMGIPPRMDSHLAVRKFAAVFCASAPKAKVIVLMLDARPEEATELRDNTRAEVVAVSCDDTFENQVKATDLLIERVERLAEDGQDVIVLIDTLNSYAKACNHAAPQTARVMSNGLANTAVNRIKRLFGQARSIREGGSVTVVGLMQLGSGSNIDDAVLEEIRAMANSTWVLTRTAKGTLPVTANLLERCGTRHDELMLTELEQNAAATLRKLIGEGSDESNAKLLSLLENTKTVAELVDVLK